MTTTVRLPLRVEQALATYCVEAKRTKSEVIVELLEQRFMGTQTGRTPYELAQEAGGDSLVAVVLGNPELLQLAATPPGAADGAADHLARGQAREAGKRRDVVQGRGGVVVGVEARVDDRCLFRRAVVVGSDGNLRAA